jgi:VIT1/CCC1 family predicted Fe2+/Mn2+ transporter
MEWVDEEISNTVKGVFSYFIGDAKELPEIDIRPLKEAYFQILVDQVIANSGDESIEQTQVLIDAVQQSILVFSPDGTVNEKVVDSAMTVSFIRETEMSRETVRKLAEQIAVMQEEDLTSVDIRDFAISEMIEDKMNIQEIQDTLDLTLLFETMYGDKENPVSETASLIDTLKNGTSSIIGTAVVLLLFIIALTAFYPKSIFRWIGSGIIISSVIMFLTALLAWVVSRNAFSESSDMLSFGVDADSVFVWNWITSYTEGFYIWLMIQAGILLLLGVLLVIVSSILPDKSKLQKKWNGTKAGRVLFERKGRIALVSIRVILVMILSFGLLVCVQFYIERIRYSLHSLERVTSSTSSETMEPADALGIVLDAEELFVSLKDENQNETKDQG